jgi:two-component system, cell cycle sensor histidine kinase and response regulator CckA
MPRASKGLLVTALLALGLQVFVLGWSRSVTDVRMISGVLTVCLAILATASAATAGCVADSYVRRFWRLTAAGFFLLSCAEIVGTYYDVVLRASLSSEWPSDVLYFLFIAPMAMTLFLKKQSRNAGFNWAQALDLFQVTILAAAVYLYYFYLPSHWQGSAAVMERLQWKFEVARDIFLIGAFALRFTFVRDRTEWSLLARLGTFLAFFCVGNIVYLYRQNAYALDAGSFWDLCYSVPIVIAIVAACTWKMPATMAARQAERSFYAESWGSLWMSVLLPLLALGVAAHMIHGRPLLATMVAVSTLASAGLRVVIVQYEQQKSAAAIAEAEQKFRALFHDNPQPTTLYDPTNGRFLEVNRAAIEKYGYSHQEFLDLTVSDICLDLNPGRLAEARRGVEFRDEIRRQRTKDGSVIEVVQFARTIEFHGRSARLVVTQDITEKRRSEKLQTALYQIAEVSTTSSDLADLYPNIHAIVADLMDAKNFYIALYDDATDWITFPYFVDEFDRVPEPRNSKRGLTEYVLRTGEALLATGQKLAALATAGEVERAGSPADDWLGVPLKKDDKPFGVLAVQHYAARTRFGDREKEVLTFVSHQVASAIQRKQSEEAMLRSEARYRSLVQSAVVGIYRATLDGRFLDVNPALVAMLGYQTGAELLSLTLQRDVFVDPESDTALHQAFLRRGRFEGVEARWKRKDGSVISVRLSGRGVRDERDGSEVFEVIAEDVTGRKALEDQLRQAQKMEAVGTLAGGIAHDFNNLLTVISGYCQILQDKHEGDEQSAQAVDQILRAADRATSLTRQMLAFGRRQMLQPRVVNLNTLVHSVGKMLEPLLGERIKIVLETTADPAAVKADPGQLEHILINLAVNARDAMPGGGTLLLRTETANAGGQKGKLSQATDKPCVVLSVRDTGVGIDPEVLAHVFEPFFTTKDPGKGTGLGLSMVYGIVEQSGGHVAIESAPGEGTTFFVYLPLTHEAEDNLASNASRPSSKPGRGKVLLVEDEPAVRDLVHAILADRGYGVFVAETAADAAALCRRAELQIDILLTDVVMPGITGPELARELLRMRPQLKVIYMTGYAGESLEEHGLTAEGSVLLQKPFTAAALEARIRQVTAQPVESEF